jgi:cyclopropane fatty-acyl-phospholipid synthase-like methyltransferase
MRFTVVDQSVPSVTAPFGRRTHGVPSVDGQRVVQNCYDVLDLANAAVGGGIKDYTDGMYGGQKATPYEVAQNNQAEWLLDEVRCHAGSRLLDIGCGNGRLLATARRRGTVAVGITISPRQIERCQRRQLDARLCDYRSLDGSYDGAFDAVVANGSIEHFVQSEQATEGRADEIYREMFAICHRVLAGATDSGRLATTVIHFGRARIDPRDMKHGPFHFRWGSDEFHYSMLVHSFGGFYPVPGQLERCAAGWFRLVNQQDGTQDYLWTSDHWLRVLRQSLVSVKFNARLTRELARHPLHVPRMMFCLLVSQSWNWQFRGNPAPMQLLRQTWQRV